MYLHLYKPSVSHWILTLAFQQPVKTNMYKILIVATLAMAVCLAEPEASAEPQWGYGGFGGRFGGRLGGYRGGFGRGFGRGGFGRGFGGRYGGFGGYGGRKFFKRSADAEPEAVPAALPEADADYVLDNEVEGPSFTIELVDDSLSTDFTDDNAHDIGKREAEAEPGYGFGGFGGFGRGFGHGFGHGGYYRGPRGFFGGNHGGYYSGGGFNGFGRGYYH